MVDTKSCQVPLSVIYIDIRFDVYGALLLLTYWLCQSGISKIVQLLIIVMLVNQTSYTRNFAKGLVQECQRTHFFLGITSIIYCDQGISLRKLVRNSELYTLKVVLPPPILFCS